MSYREVNLNHVLKYVLAAVPTSICDGKSGDLRISTSKSILKRKHQVEDNNPSIGIRYAVVIDGCAILCVIQWPRKGFLKDVVLNFVKFATNKMHSYNGHMQYLIGITLSSRMQPGVSEHARLQGNTN